MRGIVQVTDFGASKAVETGRDMTLNVGTVAYVHTASLLPLRISISLAASPLAKCRSICSLSLPKSVNTPTTEVTSSQTQLAQRVCSYMPPEIMQQFQDAATTAVLDTPKCDVFSFAVLAIYALTGMSPHEGLNNNDIFVKVSACAGQCCRELSPVRCKGSFNSSHLVLK